MTDQQLEDRAAQEIEKHPPFRLRPRRRLLLPDLTPPTLTELRWAAEQRRMRRTAPPPQLLPPAPVTEVVAPQPDPEPEPAIEDLVVDEVPLEDVFVENAEVAVDEVEVEKTEPDAPDPAEPPSPEPSVLDSAVHWPAVLEPEEAPSFARLRSRPAAPPRDRWLDRGPVIDDPDGEDVFDVEPILDLNFHPATAELPSSPESASADEPSAFFDVWADAKPLVPEPTDDSDLDLAAVDLAPWRPLATTEDPDDDPPLVAHLLVVREPRGSGSPRIAVLDDSATVPELPTIAPAAAHPYEPVDDVPATLPPDIEERFEPAPAVPKVWEGRPAPLYWRVLRLRHVRPNGWWRALFFEGSVAIAVVLVLAEAASVWTIVVLPIVVALIVKANDVLVGNLQRSFQPTASVELPDHESIAPSRDDYEMSSS